ncbi:hypothetical protein CSUI_008185, partial [Cystoisospora suis]
RAAQRKPARKDAFPSARPSHHASAPACLLNARVYSALPLYEKQNTLGPSDGGARRHPGPLGGCNQPAAALNSDLYHVVASRTRPRSQRSWLSCSRGRLRWITSETEGSSRTRPSTGGRPDSPQVRDQMHPQP